LFCRVLYHGSCQRQLCCVVVICHASCGFG
jgi:hypothetical protein